MVSDEFKISWDRVVKWLAHNAPGVYESLNESASTNEIDRLERYYKVPIPEDVKALYCLHNGQNDSGSQIVNFVYGDLFMGISTSLGYHQGAIAEFIEEIDFAGFQSVHADVRLEKDTPLHFYPILDGGGEYYLCVDLKPKDKKNVGQLICLDLGSRVAYKIQDSVTDMLVSFASDLESGVYSVSQDEPCWLQPSEIVDLGNWGYNGMDIRYPDGRST